jgi:hypothetical protein
MNTDRTSQYIKLDERNHVEKPSLESACRVELGDHRPGQQTALRQHLSRNLHRGGDAPVLREQLKVINDWAIRDIHK